MNKLLATIGAFAIVVSLFSGIALAASSATIALDNEDALYVQDLNDGATIRIQGKVTDVNDRIVEEHFSITITDPSSNTYTGIAEYGIIDIEMSGDAEEGNYTIDAIRSGWTVTQGNFDVALPMTSDHTLDLTWEDEGEFLFSGKVENYYDPVGDNTVVMILDGNYVEDAAVSSTGTFAFLFDIRSKLHTTGKLELYTAYNGVTGAYTKGDTIAESDYVNLIKIASGEVSKRTVGISVSPNEAFYSIANDITFTVDKSKLYDGGSSLIYNWILEQDTNTINAGTDANQTTDDYTKTFDGITHFTKSDRGQWDVKLEVLDINGNVVYEGASSLNVAYPDSVNLVGVKDEIYVKDGYPISWGADIKVVQVDGSGNTTDADLYIVSVEGAGIASISDKLFVVGETKTLSPTQAGTIEFVIEAYVDENSNGEVDSGDTKLGVFSESTTVSGASVTVSENRISYKKEGEIALTVENEDGSPINNAYVAFEHNSLANKYINYTGVSYDPEQNIINGVYKFEYDNNTFLQPAEYDIVVYNKSGEVIATGGTLYITGEEVYTVVTDKDVLLAGAEEEVTVTTVDEDGEFIYPRKISFITDSEDDSDIIFTSTDLANASKAKKIDTDGDNVNDSYQLKIKDFTHATTGTLTVEYYSGKKIGVSSFEVVMPYAHTLANKKVTNKYDSAVFLVLKDPRNGQMLDWNVSLSPEYAEIEGITYKGDELNTNTAEIELGISTTYKLNMVVEVDYDNEDGKTPMIKVKARGIKVEGGIEIAPATINVTPESLIIGQINNLEIEVLDANGNPLEDYSIYANDVKCGATNSEGKLEYTAQSMTSLLKIEAETDAVDKNENTLMLEKNVTATIDFEAPTVRVEEFEEELEDYVVSQDTVVITVTDNVRVTRLVVNGREANIFPLKEVTYTVTDLKEGNNKIRIQALDANYNHMDEVLEIEYYPENVEEPSPQPQPKKDPVSISIGETNEYVDQAPYLKNGNTSMVPVRFIANALDAGLGWNGSTMTATYTLGNTTVELTEGSKTAVVNGIEKEMAVAAEIKGGRMFIPVRFAAESFGATVQWIGSTQTIVITAK